MMPSKATPQSTVTAGDHALRDQGTIVQRLLTVLFFLLVQAKEEGKSLLQEIAKLKAAQESSSKQVTADLALIDIDHEFSPIASNGTTT